MTTLLRTGAILAACSSALGISACRADDRAPSTPASMPVHTAPALTEAPEASITADRLLAHIRMLPTKRSGWSDEAHQRGLRDTEKLLTDHLTALGYHVELDPVDAIGRHRDSGDKEAASEKPFNNLIIEIKGTTRPEEVLLFSAHIDAVPNAPGADDDGTGVAALLEAARVLKDRPMQRTVRLAFFNLEEAGLVGSRAYCERLKPRLEEGKEKIVGMVSIDMIGFYSDKPDSQKSPIPAMGAFKPPTVADFVGMATILKHRHFSQALNKQMKLAEPKVKTVVVDFLPIAPPDLLRSDHAPFLTLGVPALIIADTANFRNPHYHQPTDTIETLDTERFTIAAKALVGALYRLAGPAGSELIELTPPAPQHSAPPAPVDSAPGEPAKTQPPR
jgi:hypothetical protein